MNSGQLISDLLAASREPKELVLRGKEQTNQLRISALASASSSLDTFAAALTELLDGRAFAGDLVSSDPLLASVGFVDGQRPEGLPATLEVMQLASPQRLVSAAIPDSSASLGAGTLNISVGGESIDVILSVGADSLDDLAAAINSSESKVAASIVTDGDGARLVLEGPEGANETFTVTGDFSDYNYLPGGAGLSLVSEAADALVKVDGIDLRYTGNQIEGAIAGVSINLNSAEPGTQIVISGDQPISTVSNLVTEFVDAYNQLRTALNDATAPGLGGGIGGPLAGDSGIRDMIRSLGRISSVQLADNGPYRTLSDIGVKTNNDGTLAVDDALLSAALESDPEAVSAMLDPKIVTDANPGIAGAMQEIRDRLQGDNGALEVSQNRLDQIREDLSAAREKLDEESDRYGLQLQRTFANMDRQLVALQATQSYLTQQIAIWNGDNN